MQLCSTALLAAVVLAQHARAAWVTPNFPLHTAAGWEALTLTTSLLDPRHLVFHPNGHLLVLDRGVGIVAFTLNTDGSAASSRTVLQLPTLNTGIALSADGSFLFASSTTDVWKWNYDATTFTVANQTVVVSGMSNTGHVTRTIYRGRKYPSLIAISVGSNTHLDYAAVNTTSGRAQVRVFDWTNPPPGGHPYVSGRNLAYGVRNEVGLAEDAAGNLWGVENSADNIRRSTVDVHQGNPGEKLHKFGDLLRPVDDYFGGYPMCFSVYTPSLFPAGSNFQVGQWFSQLVAPYQNYTDAWCNANADLPALLFRDHSAPLDIKFGPAGDTNAYVSFHGSWNRVPSTGYKVVIVPGTVASDGTYAPAASLTNPAGYTDLLWNTDEANCTNNCFRPVGLAWNNAGNLLYVSSDATGEIIVLRRTT